METMAQSPLRRSLLAAAVAGALLTAACGAASSSPSGSTNSGSTNSGSSGAAGTLNLALTQGSYTTFNPWAQSNGINGTLWSNAALYDSLTRLDAQGQPVPSVATSWKISGKTVTLDLRTGLKFDDGTPLDATAVKANLDYGAAHASGAECNQYIQGLTAKVVSASQVELTLAKPAPGLIQDFAQCAGWLVNPKALAADAGLNAKPDGSGPYTLDPSNTVLGQKYTYVKRAGYWDAASFPFTKIVVTTFASATAADNAAKSGQIDLIQAIDPKDTASGFKVLASPPQEFRGFYITDVTGAVSKPLGDIRVRQALNYAVDREAIKKAFYGDYAAVAGSTPFPSFYQGFDASLASSFPYDEGKAKQLLADAGYSGGITIKALVDPGFQKLGQAIAGFERKVGINLDLSVHAADFITQMFTGSWPLVLGNYTLNPAQFQTLQGIAGPNGFWNPRHNSSPEIDALMTKIAAAPTPAEQGPLYAQLAKTIVDQALYVNPVIVSTISGFDAKKIAVTSTAGVPVPLLYNIKPVS